MQSVKANLEKNLFSLLLKILQTYFQKFSCKLHVTYLSWDTLFHCNFQSVMSDHYNPFHQSMAVVMYMSSVLIVIPSHKSGCMMPILPKLPNFHLLHRLPVLFRKISSSEKVSMWGAYNVIINQWLILYWLPCLL